ncbi:MAG TPA: glycosyltransferase family 39 protein [Chloroflexota bacterium]|nr:glycosyltransferase family 39 protein [Chloroflexota bacterium]
MPGTNREALSQLVSTILAPLLLVFGLASLTLVGALFEAGVILPAALVLVGAGAAVLAAVKLQAIAVGEPADAARAEPAPPARGSPPPLDMLSEAAGPPATPVFRTTTTQPGAPLVSAAVAQPAAPPAAMTSAARAAPATLVVPRVRLTSFQALLAASAVVTALAFRLVALDDLPGELFGDIATIWESVDPILKGKWPTAFEQSNGPLYGYVIAPLIAVLGQQGFLPYKIASVVVGLLAIVFTFFIARELAGTDVALIAAIVLSASSWHVVFSRLGNSQILVPTLVAGSFLLLALGVKRNDFRLVVAGAAVSTLAYYGYAPMVVLPAAYVLAAAFYVNRQHLAGLVAATGVLTIPFLFVILRQRDVFVAGSGYIGSKLVGTENWPEKIASNVWHSLLMFHFQGDATFRVNSPGMPELDVVSGILLLIGVIYWLRRPQRRWLPLLVVPFVVLQLPANLVLNEAMPTPSSSRTIGILPILAIVIAGGLWEVALRIRDARVLRPAFILLVIGVICWLNWQRYFVAYAHTLPEQNSPYGKIIAAYLDTLPPEAAVVMYNCCWAEAGQPEPKGIQYVVKRPREIVVIAPGQFSCAPLNRAGPVEVIWSPRAPNPIPESCYPGAQVVVHYDARGQPVFKDSYIPAGGTGAGAPVR